MRVVFILCGVLILHLKIQAFREKAEPCVSQFSVFFSPTAIVLYLGG
jgi:uncharacterized membrane protein